MRPIVTDGVAWSVGGSVCHDREPCKTAEPIEMPFGMLSGVGPRKHVLDGVHIGETWRIRLNRQRCGFMSNYSDHLLLYLHETCHIYPRQ